MYEKMKVVLCKPNEQAEVVEIGKDLESLQGVVDGLIEEFYPFSEKVCIVCNDKGKLNGCLPNRGIYDDNGELIDIVFGNFIICGDGGEDFDSLTDVQANKYREMFRYAERFYRVGNKVIGEKVK